MCQSYTRVRLKVTQHFKLNKVILTRFEMLFFARWQQLHVPRIQGPFPRTKHSREKQRHFVARYGDACSAAEI